MMKEARSAFWDLTILLIAQGLALVLSIIYMSLLARRLGPSTYGQYGLYLAVVQLVFCFGVNWSGTAVLRFGKEEFHLRKTIAAVFWARTAIVGVCLLMAFLVLTLLKSRVVVFLRIGTPTFLFLFPLIAILSIANYAGWILRTVNRLKAYALTFLVRQVVLISLIGLAFFAHFQLSLSKVVIFEFCSYLAITIFAFFRFNKDIFIPISLDKSTTIKLLAYSWPLILSLASGYVIEWIDMYFIKIFYSFHETGVYQAAYRMYFYLTNSLASLSTILFPVVIATAIEKKEKLLADFYLTRFTTQLTIAWTMIVSSAVIAAPLFFTTIFNKGYAQSALPFQILCIGAAFQLISYLYSSVLYTFTDLKKIAYIHIGSAALKLILDILLVPKNGMIGAAWSTTVTLVCSATAYMLLGQCYYRIRDLRAICFATAPAVIFCFTLSFSRLFIQVPFIIVFFFLILFYARKIRIFTQEDTNIFEKIVMPRPLKQMIIAVYAALSHSKR